MDHFHEIIIPNNDLPFKFFIFEGKDGNYIRQRHWHRSVEIFALFEGELEFFIEDRQYSLRPGQFMLVNSNEVHSVSSPKANKTIVLQIPLATFEKYYTDDRFIYFTRSTRLQDEEIMHLIGDMYKTYLEKSCGYELKVQSQFYMLVYILVTRYRETEPDPEKVKQNRKLNRLSGITAYIKENYEKELTLVDLAGIFGYSPTYLSRMFQKYAKINYKTYLDNVRLEHAYEDMLLTTYSIGEIAVRNGFPNSKAFAKVFKTRYGVMPSEFRKSSGELK